MKKNLLDKLEALKKTGKTLNQEQLRSVTGGFSCYCNGRYIGETNSISYCWGAC
ncbi:MAG: hypothetical protein QM654_09250 [Dysgonamonadaceae bacterium]